MYVLDLGQSGLALSNHVVTGQSRDICLLSACSRGFVLTFKKSSKSTIMTEEISVSVKFVNFGGIFISYSNENTICS